jgi:hypothetical protein
MDIQNLEVDHTYLLKLGSGGILTSVTILLISETAYHVRWNTGISSNDTWEHKDPFHTRWTVIEDVSKLVDFDGMGIKIARPITMTSTKLINCHICHGLGTVRDTKSTAGTMTCPACNGAKMIPEVITLTQKE